MTQEALDRLEEMYARYKRAEAIWLEKGGFPNQPFVFIEMTNAAIEALPELLASARKADRLEEENAYLRRALEQAAEGARIDLDGTLSQPGCWRVAPTAYPDLARYLRETAAGVPQGEETGA